MNAKEPVELERAAKHLGIPGLLQALDSKQRPLLRAAIAGSPLVDRSWLLLPRLLTLMAGADRVVASSAARATVLVAENTRLPDLDLSEENEQTLDETVRRLIAFASDRSLALDIRLQALLALAQLSLVRDLSELKPEALLALPEPKLREAAVELFALRPPGEKVMRRLAKMVARDSSQAAARAAAVVLCAKVPLTRGDPIPRALAVLRAEKAMFRLRQLSQSLDASVDQLADLARCLRASNKRADRRAYQRMRRRSSKLRRALRHMR